MIIPGAGPYKMVYPFDSVMSPFANTATVTIMYKPIFKYVRDIVVYQVVNNPVAKVCRKYFPLYRSINDKTDAGPGGISAIQDFLAQTE